MSFENTGPALSDLPTPLMIEQYGGAVDSQFAKSSIMREYANINPLTGTDTIVNNRVGKTTLKKLIPGVRPPSETTPFGRVSLTVDTVIIARDTQSLLNSFQTNFSVRDELGKDHGKQLGKFFDQAFIIMGIKGSLAAAPDFGMGPEKNSIGAGKNITLTTPGDEADPDILAAAITDIITQMEEEEIDVDELVVFVRPTQFQTLLNNNKLINKDFSSGNGDYAKDELWYINDARIIKTARIPQSEIIGHDLSNAANGNAYDITGTQANAVAVILHPKSFLAAETIPLQSDVYFDKIEKTWFIDSWMAFGVSTNRPDVTGAVFKTV